MNPNDSDVYYNRGSSYSNLKKYDKAIEDYTKAIKLNPKLKEAYIGRANVYRLVDKSDLAKSDEDKVQGLEKLDENK